MRMVLLFAGISVVFHVAAPASGATWHVACSVPMSGDGTSMEKGFKTVQEGIDAASDDDTVIVARGTYVENIRFNGKNIVLGSTDPLDPEVVSETVLDGNQAGAVVTFEGTEGEKCVLAGFTIRNGEATAVGGGICGGTWKHRTHATIQNNTITMNSAPGTFGDGGGLGYCDGTIENNVITANSANRYGGGLSRCNGTVIGNTISGNTVGYKGGGLAFCQGTIQSNTISENSAQYGGGLALCEGTIQKNTITLNSASYEGGGLAFCEGTIQGNSISENSAANNEGGGLAYCDGTIQNNTVSGNSARHGSGLSDCDGIVQNNIITENHGFFGGGLSGCDGTVQNNVITGNSVERYGGGLDYCHGTIQGNTISGNSAEEDGGGIAGCWGAIQNNLIAGNSAGGYGGGLASCRGPIQNNTITENSATYGGGLYSCRGTMGNCIVWGNMAPGSPQLDLLTTLSYSCIEGWTPPGRGEGNTSEDPLFVDAGGGDYHLRPDSPCIDAGANYYWFVWPQRDMGGNCRLAGKRVDMGCYEWGAGTDTDGDLLSDSDEAAAGTSSDREDTDGDGLRDGLEMLRESDPTSQTPPRTVHVPADLPTIQAAILLAVNGEEVVVARGTYCENPHFCGVDIILRSSDPENPDIVRSTVLDGDAAGPTVSFSGSESEACILSGFTVTGGAADLGGGIRGGNSGNSTIATIRNNTITGNSAVYGGGLYSCNGTIRNNTITENSSVRHGGGLAYCDGTIHNNGITGNSSGGEGGGIYECRGMLENNVIASNTSEGTFVWRDEVFGNGGGLALCGGTIRSNLVIGNSARCYGGGLYKCDGTIENNTIIGNSAVDDGGGVDDCKSRRFYGCILWGNTAVEGTDHQLHASRMPSYCCIQDWSGDGEGNIAEEPQFVDPAGPDGHLQTYEDNNYRLCADSPCIDAGKTEFWMFHGVDLDGNPRVSYGTSSLTVDIGCYERVFQTPGTGTWHVDASVSYSGDGSSWETALKTVQEGINVASEGDMVVVAQGTYVENIHFGGKNLILRGTDPLDHGVVSSTVIRGNRAGPAATFAGTEGETCMLSGFTIQDGSAAYGGGICGGTPNRHTHAAIENNVITSNRADHGGGLAFCDGAIRNNIIARNSATDQFGEGGGLAFCDGVIENNTISRNSSVWRGGGLGRCNGPIRNNVIYGNSSSSGGGLAYCKGAVQNNEVYENSAKVWGGGLHWCNGSIRSNIIAGNTAGWGGGLTLCDGAIQNNAIIGNSAANSGGGIAWCDAAILNCILWENEAAAFPQVYDSSPITYSCIQGWTGGGVGNISNNPRFLDGDGHDNIASTYDDNDYRLSPGSPCIDAGVNQNWMWKALDLDGNPRIFYGMSSTAADMGAYEYASWPFRIIEVGSSPGGEAELTWSSRPGDTYTVWSSIDPLGPEWYEETTIPSQGTTTSWTDTSPAGREKLSRVEMMW